MNVKKGFARLLVTALALCVVIACLPMSAFAADGDIVWSVDFNDGTAAFSPSDIVAEGPDKGLSLTDLINKYGTLLLGSKNFEQFGNKFPLLIKFIDADNDLSVQVHPNDIIARQCHNSLGKTEMWYVVNANTNANIYCGFKDNINIEKFKNADVDAIGPIRSSRHYFLDYALENNAIYAHAGWSPQAQADIPRLGVKNINGIIGNDGVNFWRDNTYDRSYHNLYTSIKKLSEYAEDKKGYSLAGGDSVLEFLKTDKEIDGNDCLSVDFRYSGSYRVGYVYNPETKAYERYINGKKHMSQTGNVIEAKNIIATIITI